MRPFHFAASRNLSSIRTPELSRPSNRDLWSTSILSSPRRSAFFSRECWFLVLAPQPVCRICTDPMKLCAVFVYKLPFQIKLAVMPTSIRPVIRELIVWLSGRGRAQREIPKITGVSQGATWKVLCRVREISSPTGASIDRRRLRHKKTVPSSVSWGETIFYQRPKLAWSWTGLWMDAFFSASTFEIAWGMPCFYSCRYWIPTLRPSDTYLRP